MVYLHADYLPVTDLGSWEGMVYVLAESLPIPHGEPGSQEDVISYFSESLLALPGEPWLTGRCGSTSC